MSDPNYVTCPCQHCNGHIKFDSSQLRKGETRQVECPHCHLETSIFHPTAAIVDSSYNNKNIKLPRSSKIELFLFQLTRFITLAGAVLIFLALIVAIYGAVQTLRPEKPKKLVAITYEFVAPLPPSAQATTSSFVAIGANVAGKNSFPQPVVDFLLTHEGFSLKEWLDKLAPEHRQAFLNNLAGILQTAKSKNLTSEQLEQVVRDFAEFWIAQNEKSIEQKTELEKSVVFLTRISEAFGLFISLTILCLILVMLAIERNTRVLRV